MFRCSKFRSSYFAQHMKTHACWVPTSPSQSTHSLYSVCVRLQNHIAHKSHHSRVIFREFGLCAAANGRVTTWLGLNKSVRMSWWLPCGAHRETEPFLLNIKDIKSNTEIYSDWILNQAPWKYWILLLVIKLKYVYIFVICNYFK